MSSRERARVLFVDDQERARQLFLRAVDTDTFEARAAASVPEGEALIETWRPDVIVTDLRMPEVDGLEGLQRFRRLLPEVPVIVVTAFGTVETAVESMRRGAFDYLSKPFEQDQIEMVMTRALRHRALLAENARLRTELAARDQEQSQGQGGVVGRSRAVAQAVALVNRVAPTDYPVLIQGESGTGKDVFARLIHERSARSARRSCRSTAAAIPENLLESELFGYEKGAFSGAVSARAGFFERADGGTLFLDEIGDMSVNLQPKLLRVLQDGEYYPVGSRKPCAHRCPAHRGVEPEHPGTGRIRAVPSGPLLPHQHGAHRAATAARASGGRPAPRPAFPARAAGQTAPVPAAHAHVRRGVGRVVRLHLARKRA
jgi:two-component system response regulator AtoC